MMESNTSSHLRTFLHYFRTHYSITTLGDTTWSHAVNSKSKLREVLQDYSMIIESDIRVSDKGEIIAAHPPATESDLSLESLLEHVKNSNKGLKLDFKDPEAVAPSLKVLKMTGFERPVILNADILQGNGAAPSKFNAHDFLDQCESQYSSGFLSLGWTTVPDVKFQYTTQNIDEMLEVCKSLSCVTFPVRACLLPASWQEIQRLLVHDNYTLTIWNNEPVDARLRDWMRTHTNPQKTFYDIIDENKEPLRLW